MKPPEPTVAGKHAIAADQAPAVSVCPEVIRKRADFLRAARGRRHVAEGFVLQAIKRPADGENNQIRVGYTCSKKVGNAVARNRAKRRLREIARMTLGTGGRPGWDYVLVGRAGKTAQLPFEALIEQMENALARIHGEKK